MSAPSRHLILVAGEASGDIHAAHLVNELRHLDPALTFSGLGGPQMKRAGVAIDDDLTRLALIGFVEVIRHYPEIRRIFHEALKRIDERRPAAVILIDYPGFNLRLARELKKRGHTVIYYVSPQIWAWKENRIHAIRKTVDRMMVLFAFEKDFYAQRGVDVAFVGHPLLDQIRPTAEPAAVRHEFGLAAGERLIGLLPGSRQKEIENLLPVMLDAARILHDNGTADRFVIFQAETVRDEWIRPLVDASKLPAMISQGNYVNGVNACDACLVASGTATLETAILGKPMVVVYKTAFLTYLLARMLLRIPYISLVNIVAGKNVVPECLQDGANGERLAGELQHILNDPQRRQKMIRHLAAVRSSLGDGGASRRAAEEVLKVINKTPAKEKRQKGKETAS